jgi:hypothetical protein
MARSKKKELRAESSEDMARPGKLPACTDFSKPWTVDRGAYDKAEFAELVMSLKTSTSKLEYHPDNTVTFHFKGMRKSLETQNFSQALESL